MQKIVCTAIAALFVATSAHASDWRVDRKEKLYKAIEIAQQSRTDRCGPQTVESIRLACEAGFNMGIAHQKALITDLDYMISVDSIESSHAELKDTLKSAATVAAYANGVKETADRFSVIETTFKNRYQQSALEPKKQ